MINEITIRIGKHSRKVQCPGSWDDLGERTFLLFYSTLFTTPGDEFSQTAFTTVKLLSMTQHLLRIDSSMLAHWEADCLKQDRDNGEAMFLDELRQVMHLVLDGLFEVKEDEEGGTTYSCRLNRTENLWPSLAPDPKKKGSPWLYAPADGLGNITIYELGFVFTLFENYLRTNEARFADELLAVLYRPSRPMTKQDMESGWGGDRRQRLRGYESKIPERAKMMATLPELTRRVMLFWFASCRQVIVNTYPKVFRKDGDGSEKPGYGWGGVLLSIANGPAGLDAVADQHYSNALTWLSMKAEEVEEMERRMEKAKHGR